EGATARGSHAAGAGLALSTLSTVAMEEGAAAAGDAPRWFQLYVHCDRGLTTELVNRATAAGYEALCVTVDAPLLGRRERDEANAFHLPDGVELENLKGLGATTTVESDASSGLFAYFVGQIDPALSWNDIDRLAAASSIPIVLKGVLHPDDVALARDHGAAAVVVSNHGGRQLDTAVDTATALKRITDVHGEEIELLVDGGIRRGSDILKALALGASSVMVGRPVLWGLATDGAAGVQTVLQILIDELDLTMALCGTPSVDEIRTADLLQG
ncbi:MAG: alpha-hydroxy-acid oxidizing protein, partial [Spirochaetales bacterium]|nr:alpha-hydroxy-acid oxidizing protein [Spirochaetales bacterium]